MIRRSKCCWVISFHHYGDLISSASEDETWYTNSVKIMPTNISLNSLLPLTCTDALESRNKCHEFHSENCRVYTISWRRRSVVTTKPNKYYSGCSTWVNSPFLFLNALVQCCSCVLHSQQWQLSSVYQDRVVHLGPRNFSGLWVSNYLFRAFRLRLQHSYVVFLKSRIRNTAGCPEVFRDFT